MPAALPMPPDQIPETALLWHREGRGAVLATVIETWGSAPRRLGAQMVIGGDGGFLGSVSGGCVEAAVVLEAGAALAAGEARLLAYGVADETAFKVGLACGGRIKLLLEPVGSALSEAALAGIVAARQARRPLGHALTPGSWQRRAVEPAEAPEAFRLDRSGPLPTGEILLLDVPPMRLVIVGGVQIARALVPMAALAGIAPLLIDPREAFANPARFPDIPIFNDWPDAAIAALKADARTAIVTLTHDPKLDDPAILAALDSPCGHLACLGSRRTHAARCERLRAQGITEADLARIEAPAGLRIGASTPEEIAVSVLAGVVRGLRGAV